MIGKIYIIKEFTDINGEESETDPEVTDFFFKLSAVSSMYVIQEEDLPHKTIYVNIAGIVYPLIYDEFIYINIEEHLSTI